MQSKEIVLELLKEKYEYEKERRRYFDDGLNIPVTILTVIVGGTYTLLSDDKINRYSFSSVCVICIICLALISLYYLWRTYFGLNRRYSSFPTSLEIVQRRRVLEEYYKKKLENGNSEDQEEIIDNHIKADLEEDLVNYYVDINTNNVTVNDLRADALFEAKKYIGLSIVIAILLFLLEYIKLLT